MRWLFVRYRVLKSVELSPKGKEVSAQRPPKVKHSRERKYYYHGDACPASASTQLPTTKARSIERSSDRNSLPSPSFATPPTRRRTAAISGGAMTPRDARANNGRHPSSRSNQRARILALLISARGDWIPLPQIAACAAQYNARVFDLRRMGFKIVNRTRDVNGVRYSWFRLESGSLEVRLPATNTPPAPKAAPISDSDSLFGDLSPEPEYPA
jgi:hypothetical protein